MADTKISALTDRPAGSLAGTDEVVLRVAGLNYRASLTSLKTWLITQLTTFVTLTGAQTLTNKTLTNPIINGGTFTKAGTFIDTLATNLDLLDATVENILSAIGSMSGYKIVDADSVQTLTNKTLTNPKINSITKLSAGSEDIDASAGWCWYSARPTASGASYTLSASTILAGTTNKTTFTDIDPANIFIQYADVSGNTFSLMETTGISYTKDDFYNTVDNVIFTTTTGHTYQINIKFRMKYKDGV